MPEINHKEYLKTFAWSSSGHEEDMKENIKNFKEKLGDQKNPEQLGILADKIEADIAKTNEWIEKNDEKDGSPRAKYLKLKNSKENPEFKERNLVALGQMLELVNTKRGIEEHTEDELEGLVLEVEHKEAKPKKEKGSTKDETAEQNKRANEIQKEDKNVHEVKKGDTLGAITKGLTGSLNWGMEVDYRSKKLDADKKPEKLADANLIYPGQKVWVEDGKIIVDDEMPGVSESSLKEKEAAPDILAEGVASKEELIDTTNKALKTLAKVAKSNLPDSDIVQDAYKAAKEQIGLAFASETGVTPDDFDKKGFAVYKLFDGGKSAVESVGAAVVETTPEGSTEGDNEVAVKGDEKIKKNTSVEVMGKTFTFDPEKVENAYVKGQAVFLRLKGENEDRKINFIDYLPSTQKAGALEYLEGELAQWLKIKPETGKEEGQTTKKTLEGEETVEATVEGTAADKQVTPEAEAEIEPVAPETLLNETLLERITRRESKLQGIDWEDSNTFTVYNGVPAVDVNFRLGDSVLMSKKEVKASGLSAEEIVKYLNANKESIKSKVSPEPEVEVEEKKSALQSFIDHANEDVYTIAGKKKKK